MTAEVDRVFEEFLGLSEHERSLFLEHLLRVQGKAISKENLAEENQEWQREIARRLQTFAADLKKTIL